MQPCKKARHNTKPPAQQNCVGGFAFKLYGKGDHSGKTVQPCGDAFGGKIDIRVQGLQVPQVFVITAAAGGAEQVHVFFGQVVAFNKSWDDAQCGVALSVKKLYMDITRSEKQGNPGNPTGKSASLIPALPLRRQFWRWLQPAGGNNRLWCHRALGGCGPQSGRSNTGHRYIQTRPNRTRCIFPW